MGSEPTPFWTGALSQRLRLLGQSVSDKAVKTHLLSARVLSCLEFTDMGVNQIQEYSNKLPWEPAGTPGAATQSIYATFFLPEWGFGTPMDGFIKPKPSLWCNKPPWEPQESQGPIAFRLSNARTSLLKTPQNIFATFCFFGQNGALGP